MAYSPLISFPFFPFCRLSIFRLPRRGLPRPICTARATTPLPPLHSYHACVYPGYHAEGYHAPYLPPRAITPVYTSRLPHQSYHAPPIHVHRVITPAISNSYFVVLPFTFTPPLLLLHHHRAPHATTYSTDPILIPVHTPGLTQMKIRRSPSRTLTARFEKSTRDSSVDFLNCADDSISTGNVKHISGFLIICGMTR